MNQKSFDSLRHSGVEFSAKGVSKVYGTRIEHFKSRDVVREIHLKHGRSGKRRWLQMVIVLASLGWAAGCSGICSNLIII